MALATQLSKEQIIRIRNELEDIEVKLMKMKADLLEEEEPTEDDLMAIEEGERDFAEGRTIKFVPNSKRIP
jgi:hypothetical protein